MPARISRYKVYGNFCILVRSIMELPAYEKFGSISENVPINDSHLPAGPERAPMKLKRETVELLLSGKVTGTTLRREFGFLPEIFQLRLPGILCSGYEFTGIRINAVLLVLFYYVGEGQHCSSSASPWCRQPEVRPIFPSSSQATMRTFPRSAGSRCPPAPCCRSRR